MYICVYIYIYIERERESTASSTTGRSDAPAGVASRRASPFWRTALRSKSGLERTPVDPYCSASHDWMV